MNRTELQYVFSFGTQHPKRRNRTETLILLMVLLMVSRSFLLLSLEKR